MAEAMEEVLSPDDATRVAEELLPAQNKSYYFGLKLNLPQHKVEAIHSKYSEPVDRLHHVITEFLNQIIEPRPTWRVIIEALRSPIVNLKWLASELELAHFPKPNTDGVPLTASDSKACSSHPTNVDISIDLLDYTGALNLLEPHHRRKSKLEDIVKHKQEMERYKEQEDSLAAKIKEVFSQEQSAQSQKKSAEAQLQQLTHDLSQHKRELNSARENYEKAKKKRKKKKRLKRLVHAVAVVALPLGAPALAGGAIAGAEAFRAGEDRAARAMEMIQREISETKHKITTTESTISSLSTKITDLNREIQQYESEQKEGTTK